MTSDYLSKFTNDDGEKQTCNVEMRHLYKRIYFKPGLKGTGVILKSVHRDCCAKFATGICIIINSAFSFNFLTKFHYKHLKYLISKFHKAL